MSKSRFTKTQLVSILKEAENGVPVIELCRQHGISSATYYKWKSKYGGLEASDLKLHRELEAEKKNLYLINNRHGTLTARRLSTDRPEKSSSLKLLWCRVLSCSIPIVTIELRKLIFLQDSCDV